jgi:hypothetical protein
VDPLGEGLSFILEVRIVGPRIGAIGDPGKSHSHIQSGYHIRITITSHGERIAVYIVVVRPSGRIFLPDLGIQVVGVCIVGVHLPPGPIGDAPGAVAEVCLHRPV